MRRDSVLGAVRLGMMCLLSVATAQTAWSQLPPKVQTPGNTKARSLLEKAQQHVKERDFVKAVAVLTQLNQKFPSFGDGFLLKGSLLKAMGDNRGALAAYRDGLAKVSVEGIHASEYQLVGDLALSYGEYQTALDAYRQLMKVAPKTQKNLAKSQRQLLTCEFALEALKHPVGEAPVPLPAPLNAFKFQYFPDLTADNRFLLFTGRPAASSGEDLYVSRQNKDGSMGEPQPISPAINSSYNEGAGSISGDGKTLVFASCDRPKAIGNCDLYISRRTGNNWSAPVNLGLNVNSTEWDSQPSLSADGRTLYFTSTRRGGQGQEDIYMSTLQPDGNWSPAQNVGTPVNTPGKDMAPFIHASGTTLYYVTDGLVGMGGLDVFRCEKTAAGTWTSPTNLGYPLNTFENEASLFITSDNLKGFCSRSRATEEPTGGYRLARERPVELFSFAVPPPVKARETSTYTQGRVFDANTKKPLKAEVKLYDLDTDVLTQFVTSDPEYGDYTVVLNEGHHYAMYAAANKYLLKSLSFDYSNQHAFNPTALDIYLEPVRSGRSVVLNNLFFDTNKFDLKPQSRTELNRLIEFLRQYRDVQIEVSGYTDNVGSPETNSILSQRRAQSVVEYLSAHAISPTRLRSRGYGETHPLAANDTEAHRQLNRRIELHIL
ncbi:OmpA family protein [Hymenobacter sp. UYCo722]|uniref:OmpA family protein n=1 Tax=Hymenobacter sp. UYCo722 TaxID=3156335 RepID=UPI0033907C5C